MKSPGSTLLLRVALAFVLMAPAFPSVAGDLADKKQRLYLQLKNLPSQAARASKVKRLVSLLARLNPARAEQYYRVGLQRLPQIIPNKVTAISLWKTVASRVSKSDLTPAAKEKITTGIRRACLKWENSFPPIF